MALMKCGECGNEISDKATACPKCGAPVSGPSIPTPNPKRKGGISIMGWVILIAGLGIIASVALSPDGALRTNSPAPKQWAPSAEDLAKQADRLKLIDKMGRAGVWSKWETCELINVCLWVRSPFYNLDFDKKKDLVELFWSYQAVEKKSNFFTIRLRDSQSGRDVGHYERHKLTMM